MSPKMHNKHAFSPGVLYIEHVWNDVLFHNRKLYLNLKTHFPEMLLYDKQSENDSDLKDITEYNHISIRMYNFSLNEILPSLKA